jgi:DNA topoisomerase-1
MAKNLLIVESPAKAKTINKYLGKDFTVLALRPRPRPGAEGRRGRSRPRLRDALRPDREEREARRGHRQGRQAADALYLATDPDREGEAISWHIAEILRERGCSKDKPLQRVVFTEITPRAIKEAMRIRAIAMDLVNAQQARRALDYLVGFNLSPVLWRKVQRGLSAGRVQSPALRMIVEREEEIEAFKAHEYWSIEAESRIPSQGFTARLSSWTARSSSSSPDPDQRRYPEARARASSRPPTACCTSPMSPAKERKRRPAPPFTTSTLQQEAARKLGFTTRKTMQVAQKLYEGVAIGEEGTVGLISYMRTDRVAAYLSPDHLKLYELIWKRTVACQMQHATLNTVSVDFPCGADAAFRATGTTVIDPGFLAVYEEGRDQKSADDEDDARKLPTLKVGEAVPLRDILTDQHFTEPPPRYSEASLVKALEEYGIGRPSTYASIIQVLLNREYVILDSRRFRPTDVGRAVGRFLGGHFARYVDYDFTARLEDELDAVSRGEEDWIPLLSRFWKPFKAQVDDKLETVDKSEASGSRVLGVDPASGKPLSVRLGRFGPFAQIGTKDDEDKPRFASLRSGQSMHTISLEEALELFKLPRTLGVDEKDEPVTVGIGRFGPFVKIGSTYASLAKEDDPYTIELPRALELVRARLELLANRIIKDFGNGIQILNGRYGPYITDGEKNARIPKDREPAQLTEAECAELLAAAPNRPKRGFKKGANGKAAAAKGESAKAKKAPAKKAAGKKAASKKTATAKKASGKSPARKTPARKSAVTGATKKTTRKSAGSPPIGEA